MKNRIFFTSDLHFEHNNIIQYCNRPFSTIESMNNMLINRWNNVVTSNDTVYVLGDIGCWYNKEYRSRVVNNIKQLNGTKMLIIGNHDHAFDKEELLTVFESIHERLVISVEMSPDRTQKIVLDHFPLVSWDGQHHGSWQLFGHIHSVNNQSSVKDRLCIGQYDVGVDNNNFTPVSLNELNTIFTKQMLYGKN